METRKIQVVKGGTYTVSLPQEWAESEDIDQGSPVRISSHFDGVLTIHPEQATKDKQQRVTAHLESEEVNDIEYLIRAAYTVGVDELRLTGCESLTEKQRQRLRDFVRMLTGVTIVAEKESELTFGMLLDSEKISVEQLVRQLEFAVLSMHREAMAIVTNAGPKTTLADRDDQTDRLYAMIDRSFQRALVFLDEMDALGLTRFELVALWSTARELERVADHAERIATVDVEQNESGPLLHEEDFLRTAQLARTAVEDAVTSIVGEGGLETARDALALRDEVRDETMALNRRLFEESSVGYHHARVLDSLRRTAEHGSNIAQCGIQAAFRREGTSAPDQLTPTQ